MVAVMKSTTVFWWFSWWQLVCILQTWVSSLKNLSVVFLLFLKEIALYLYSSNRMLKKENSHGEGIKSSALFERNNLYLKIHFILSFRMRNWWFNSVSLLIFPISLLGMGYLIHEFHSCKEIWNSPLSIVILEHKLCLVENYCRYLYYFPSK